MEIYKGASAFAGIAIGKIRFYRKGEYQIRQHQADDVKKELKNFDVARRHVMQTLKEEYDRMSEKQMDTADPELDMEPQPLDRIVKVNGENGTNQILEQAELLGSGSFLRAVQSMITGEKVTAAYAVQTTRDEMQSTFSRLNDPTIKERIHNVSRISSLLLEILGEDENKIDLGEEPVILAADALWVLSPAKVLLPLTLRSLRKIWIFPVLQVLGFHSQKKSGKTALPLLTDIREPSIWNRIMRYEKNTRFAEKQIW